MVFNDLLPLFHPLAAFFSPLAPPSSRHTWTQHGGRIATSEAVSDTGCAIDIYFAVHGQPDPLVDRLRVLQIELYDVRWLAACIAQRALVDRSPFSFSSLALTPLPPSLVNLEFLPDLRIDEPHHSPPTQLPHKTPPSRELLPAAPTPRRSPSAPAHPHNLATRFAAVSSLSRTSTAGTTATGASDAAVERYLLPARPAPSPSASSHNADEDAAVREALVSPPSTPTQVEATPETEAEGGPSPQNTLEAFFAAPLRPPQEGAPPAYDADALLALLRGRGAADVREGVRAVEHGKDGWRVRRLGRSGGGEG
ncbi:hypothetical protein JCM10450v2_002258 [Rhodotorula kratochvilovae]